MNSLNQQFAEKICHYACELKAQEKVWIECVGLNAVPLVKEICREARQIGAIPFVKLVDTEISRQLLADSDDLYWQSHCELDGEAKMAEMDAYIGIRASENIYETSEVSAEKQESYSKYYLKPVHLEKRVKGTKWVVMRYPSPAFAMNAKMSTASFEKFYYEACLLDYSALEKAMQPLHDLLKKTDMIHLKGEGTDISFSVKGQNWIPCVGKRNLPDGEIFSSPILDSVNGHITYVASVYQGKPFDYVKLFVKDGVVQHFESSNQEALELILNTDKGAKRFGEFAFGTNTAIQQPMFDILFDEKIYGSNHLTLGQDYEEASNGNASQIHWDLVNIGSDVYCDGLLIRKGRLFVLDNLQALNPAK